MSTRSVPTPADLAAGRCGAPLTAAPTPTCQAPAARTQTTAAPRYDRRAWEAAVQTDTGLYYAPRLVAFVLAHHAGTDGYLPAGGIQHLSSLAEKTRLTQRSVKLSLRDLERTGLIRRVATPQGQQTHVARAITLTIPSAPGARQEPPSTGDAS
ncbi:hypothetical protein [Streptomyces sp. bgisy027]|uniref:hypothetical protein n=1 Tax=Streptomyces sp. bgisy027 TaxID=3413770 RepID=UPI003D7500C5